MTILSNYNQFNGIHWETGTVHNHLAARGFTAPHTGKPYSEALLMGVSGGAVMAYLSFSYEGHDPHARILTRNTFDPWDKMLSRLGVIQTIKHSTKPEKGHKNLRDTLEDGVAPIVWADSCSLAYNNNPYGEDMWAVFPLIVYGVDTAADLIYIADGASVPLTATTAEFAAARSRIKKFKHRLITLDPPDEAKLPAAVQAGIWDTINLYTEKPPKGSKNNFGLLSFAHLQKVLTKPKTRLSWEKEFPAGRKMAAGLRWFYFDIMLFGKNSPAERDVYADFLDEAAVILQKPTLSDVGAKFRDSQAAWADFADLLLPADVPYFKETGGALYTVETHLRYLAEVKAPATVEIESVIIDADHKRIWFAHEMIVDGSLRATGEFMILHFDTRQGKTTPMPEDVQAALQAAKLSEAPDWAASQIGLNRR